MRRIGVISIRIAVSTGIALGAAMLPAQGSAAEDQACQAWTGELSPLPSTESRDTFEARWATLRASELERLAKALEPNQPGLAQPLWSHVRCLDPRNKNAEQKAQALRPQIAFSPRPFVIRAKPTVAAAAKKPAPTDFSAIDRALGEAEGELNQARFARAVELTEQTRRDVEGRGDSADLRERRARLEVIAATALVALGRSEDAAESFARALRADPELELDPERTPPKIRRLFQQVREQATRQGTAQR
jgi:tetratricopeptide (TPR) repeat protein